MFIRPVLIAPRFGPIYSAVRFVCLRSPDNVVLNAPTTISIRTGIRCRRDAPNKTKTPTLLVPEGRERLALDFLRHFSRLGTLKVSRVIVHRLGNSRQIVASMKFPRAEVAVHLKRSASTRPGLEEKRERRKGWFQQIFSCDHAVFLRRNCRWGETLGKKRDVERGRLRTKVDYSQNEN